MYVFAMPTGVTSGTKRRSASVFRKEEPLHIGKHSAGITVELLASPAAGNSQVLRTEYALYTFDDYKHIPRGTRRLTCELLSLRC